MISEDENTVDFDSRLLGYFRGGREKGELCFVVRRRVFAGIKVGL